MIEIIFLLLMIAVGQGIFLCFSIVLYQRKIRWINILLGLLFLAFSLQLFDFVLLYSQKALKYPHLVFWSVPFNFAFGPLLYLYIQSSRVQHTRFTKTLWLHFIPFFVHCSYITIIYHLHTTAYKISFIQQLLTVRADSSTLSPGLQEVIFSIIIYTHFGIYIWMSFMQIRKLNAFEIKTLAWLKKLWAGMLVIGIFGLLQYVFLIANINQQPFTGYLAAVLAIIYIYYGAVIVIKRPEVIFNPTKPGKYRYSDLTDVESKHLLKKLRKYMKEQAPYKNADLTLKNLASLTQLSDRHISQVINEQLGQNFHEFLNEYRVNEFKKQLRNPTNAHLSMLGIAMECGFNSKSTFNSAFKRSTGLTPSEFKKQILNNF